MFSYFVIMLFIYNACYVLVQIHKYFLFVDINLVLSTKSRRSSYNDQSKVISIIYRVPKILSNNEGQTIIVIEIGTLL